MLKHVGLFFLWLFSVCSAEAKMGLLLDLVLVWILSGLSLTSSFLSIFSFIETRFPNGNVLGPCRFFKI